MSRPHIPTPLEELGNRPFSFYPAIWNIGHNEWTLRRATWDEFQVVNTKTRAELWISRRFVSGVSSAEEPVVIVGLCKELELREGVLSPRVQRVIEMPSAVLGVVNDVPRWQTAQPIPGKLAPVVGIRVESTTDDGEVARPPSSTWRAKVAAGVLVCVVGLVFLRDFPLVARGRTFVGLGPNRVPLPFTANDDYESIVGRLGHPEISRDFRASNGEQFHLLRYPDRGLVIVLAGGDRDQAHYVGAFGPGRRVVHTVRMANGSDSGWVLGRLGF